MRKSTDQSRMITTSFNAASPYEKGEFVELGWENGEMQVRGPSCRWKSEIVEDKGEKRGKLGSNLNFPREREDSDRDHLKLKYTTPTVDVDEHDHQYPHRYHHDHHLYSENMAAAAAAVDMGNDSRVVPEYENECADDEHECPEYEYEYEYAHLKPALAVLKINNNAISKSATAISSHHQLRGNSPRGNCSEHIYSSSLPQVLPVPERQAAKCVSDRKTPTPPHDSHSSNYNSRRSTDKLSHISRLVRLATTFPKPKPNTNTNSTTTNPCTCTCTAAAATNYSFITLHDTHQRPKHHLESLIIMEKVVGSNPTPTPTPTPTSVKHSEAFGNKLAFEQPRVKTPPISKPKTKTSTATQSPPPVPSSSVCSLGASNTPAHAHPFKRRSEETHEQYYSAYPCESVEEQPKAVTKAPPIARRGGGRSGGTSSKRNRTAQIHNCSEKRRRDTINKKMRELQELLPNCNKVDKVSMLDEAIEYLKTLQLQLQMLSMGNGIMAPHQMMLPAGAPHLCDPLMMMRSLGSSLLHIPTTATANGTGGGNTNYTHGFQQMLPFPAQLLPFNTIPLHSLNVPLPPAISRPTSLFHQQYYFASIYSNPYLIPMFYNNNTHYKS